MRPTLFSAVILTIALSVEAPGVTLFQVDRFDSGVAGWAEGGPSPNKPTVDDTGLPGGPFLRNDSSGGGGPGSRQLMWNDAQWTGDFIGAGIVAIEFDAISLGLVDFRFAFNGAGGWFFTESIRIAEAATVTELVSYLLPITEADLTYASGGSGIYSDTLGGVTRMEIISALGTPTVGFSANVLQGDAVVSTLIVDNIRAIPEPGSAVLVLFATIALSMRRRHRRPTAR